MIIIKQKELSIKDSFFVNQMKTFILTYYQFKYFSLIKLFKQSLSE